MEGKYGQLVTNLKQCGKTKDLKRGKLLHYHATQTGCHTKIHIACTLISMYSKCGCMQEARDVFNKMIHPNVVAWTALIDGYVENGQSLVALELFNNMDCAPNYVTFVAALKACAGLSEIDRRSSLRQGALLHERAKQLGFHRDMTVASTLIHMYNKCGDMLQARSVFDGMKHRNAVSWNTLLLGYVDKGESSLVLRLFRCMDCPPNHVTFIAALKACTKLASGNTSDKAESLEKGMAIHRQARELGFHKDMFVASTLVDMYSTCGDMSHAKEVFDGMTRRSAVTWNAIILGYVENGQASKALELFTAMDDSPNRVTYVAVLKTCSCLAELNTGHRVHQRICELGLDQDAVISTCLVDLYGKCGKLSTAEEVFNRMHSRDVVAWTAFIGGHSLLGHTDRVVSLVKEMQEAGIKLDGVTMNLILTACSHAGEVEHGQRCFERMSEYGVKPTLEHYTCMVDMLGRANRLEEALSLVNGMPYAANSVIWTSLLGVCEKRRNFKVGQVAFDALVALNEDKDSVAVAHVLMKNICESLGMQTTGDKT